MKKVILICTTALWLILLTSCSKKTEKKSDTNIQKSVVVIIQDQSGSTIPNPKEIEIQKQFLKKYGYLHFKPNIDILVMDLNSYSGAATNHVLIPFKDQKPKADEYQSETDKMLEESQKEMENRSEIKRMQRKLFEVLFEQAKQPSYQTAILEILPEIEQQTASYSHIKLVFMSDMYQESSIMRDFDSTFPATKKQAEKMAENDYQKLIADYPLVSKAFQKVKRIDILVPTGNDSKMTSIPFYWEELFKKMNYSKQVYWSSL